MSANLASTLAGLRREQKTLRRVLVAVIALDFVLTLLWVGLSNWARFLLS